MSDIKHLRSAIAVMALCAMVAPVGAQQTGPPTPTFPSQAATPPAGPTLQLSMEEAVTMAMETSLDLKAQRLAPDIAAQGIVGARAAFLPIATVGIQRNNARSPAETFADGTQSVAESNTWGGGGSLQQALQWYGASYNVNWSGNRRASLGGGTFNPSLQSSLRIDFTQPLWRDREIDPNRAGLESAERRRAISDLQVEQRVVATQANVRFAYLNLIAAIEGLAVAQENLRIREQTLQQARSRVEVGVAPRIEIVQNEAEVASNREQVIVAEAAISTAEDVLRTLVLDPARPDYWQLRLQPTDKISLTPRDIDVDQAIKNALANRLDLVIERRNLEITDLNIRLTENNTKTTVDFQAQYLAVGSGGRFLLAPEIGSRGFGRVLHDTFVAEYPSWTFGVNISYPLGRSAADANLAQQELQRQQQLLALRQAELAVVQDVRDAGRQVQNSFERVRATQAALTASQQQLEAEDRRFQVGLSTTLDLQVSQSRLSSARVAQLRAMIDYNRALINFDRVQKIQ